MRRLLGLTMMISGFLLEGRALDGGEAPSVYAVQEYQRSLTAAAEAETPSRVTFFSEAGFWGDRLTAEIVPGPTWTVRLITKTEIEDANLLQRISSMRLECGSRASLVTLFDSYNTTSSIRTWSKFAKSASYVCNANETQSINLHADWSYLADKVGSVYFVAHASGASEFPFSFLVLSFWNAGLQDLPSGATANEGGEIKLTGSTSFRLRQDLRLDHWACGDRGAEFELLAFMYQNKTFSVNVASTYVDTAWGDYWGCRNEMEEKLDSAAATAATLLEESLEKLVDENVGGGPPYYFVPSGGLTLFDLYRVEEVCASVLVSCADQEARR